MVAKLHHLFLYPAFLHYFQGSCVPSSWAGILKACPAVATDKMIDGCESRKKHGMLTKQRNARVGRHFCEFLFYACQCSICTCRVCPVSLWCTFIWSALEVTWLQWARKDEQSSSQFLVVSETSLNYWLFYTNTLLERKRKHWFELLITGVSQWPWCCLQAESTMYQTPRLSNSNAIWPWGYSVYIPCSLCGFEFP